MKNVRQRQSLREQRRVSHSVTKFWFYYFVLSAIEVLVLPLIVYRTIKEIRLFRKCSRIVIKAINEDKEFFKFLDTHGFVIASFTRMYSVQEIPKELKKLEEEEIYEKIIQSLIAIQPIFERNQLLDILVADLSLIDENTFIFFMEIFNFKAMMRFVYKLALSIVLYAVTAILLAMYL